MRRAHAQTRRAASWTARVGATTIEVARTDCVVRATPAAVLINSANEALDGARLPYFPRGGPCPPPPPAGLEGSANSWGALEVGPGFVFPEQSVDGVVSRLGGAALRRAVERLPRAAERNAPSGTPSEKDDARVPTLQTSNRAAAGIGSPPAGTTPRADAAPRGPRSRRRRRARSSTTRSSTRSRLFGTRTTPTRGRWPWARPGQPR